MSSQTTTYGNLIRVGSCGAPEVLRRVPLGANTSSGGIDEPTLQDLLFRFPQTLPIAEIDPSYSGAVPVCKELVLPAGYADALYINQLGRITLAEFKLWRNPQARREVIGQILDYAKDLASWNYEDLQRQVSLALGETGNALYDLVRAHHPDIGEAEFVDNVTRNLRRGEFLLLIIGDGIQEGAASIVDFVQRYSGLHFNLGLVEAALYRDAADSLMVQPRILARTEIVQRFVIETDGAVAQDVRSVDADARQEPHSQDDTGTLRFWSAVVRDFSFQDNTVSVPNPKADWMLAVPVRRDGTGGLGLNFYGHLNDRKNEFDCYLVPDRKNERAKRIFEGLVPEVPNLDWANDEQPERWESANGQPRLGFRTEKNLAFLLFSEEQTAYIESVEWMRQHLDKLVSTLNPLIQRCLEDDQPD
ncbi:MAG: hypothetical protein F4W95_05450 [Chloroflexi bacterium]|nr:hypothetical protein [Chloroflexota bacterium]MYD47913.1 hypothetical protein [Chloroflexota bacterium]